MKPEKRLLPKTKTGIEGLDEITDGGLPKGRTSLVCGSAGTGKTVFALEFLVHGILDFDEPGVFMSFEETDRELSENVGSFGFDLDELQREGKLVVDHVFIEAARLKRRASTTSKAFLSVSARRSNPLEPSVSFWTRLRCCSQASRIIPSFVRNCGACFAG
jgi:KaiC/GvpD/RAD55 family RecA-like ATPase